jgi:hypothetical protein
MTLKAIKLDCSDHFSVKYDRLFSLNPLAMILKLIDILN